MKLLILLVGMVLILEGVPYVAAPELMKNWLKMLSEMDASHLRAAGLAAMAAGLLICWVVQSSSSVFM